MSSAASTLMFVALAIRLPSPVYAQASTAGVGRDGPWNHDGTGPGRTQAGMCEIRAVLPETEPTNPFCDTAAAWPTEARCLATCVNMNSTYGAPSRGWRPAATTRMDSVARWSVLACSSTARRSASRRAKGQQR